MQANIFMQFSAKTITEH